MRSDHPGLHGTAQDRTESWCSPRYPHVNVLLTLDAVRPGAFNLEVLDDCHTRGLTPEKSHWAQRLDTPPYWGYPLRPGITFTYLGLRVDETMRVMRTDGAPMQNVYAAGEIMSGNVLRRGYIAGIGMTIGTVFGRIAGESAARAAR